MQPIAVAELSKKLCGRRTAVYVVFFDAGSRHPYWDQRRASVFRIASPRRSAAGHKPPKKSIDLSEARFFPPGATGTEASCRSIPEYSRKIGHRACWTQIARPETIMERPRLLQYTRHLKEEGCCAFCADCSQPCSAASENHVQSCFESRWAQSPRPHTRAQRRYTDSQTSRDTLW